MRKVLSLVTVIPIIAAAITSVHAATGEELFERHCARCHPNGGNIINPNQTLHKKDLDRRGIKTSRMITNIIHNSAGPKMPTFSTNVIPKKDSKLIADYIFKTFR